MHFYAKYGYLETAFLRALKNLLVLPKIIQDAGMTRAVHWNRQSIQCVENYMFFYNLIRNEQC